MGLGREIVTAFGQWFLRVQADEVSQRRKDIWEGGASAFANGRISLITFLNGLIQ